MSEPGRTRHAFSSEPIVDFAMRWLIDIAFACFVLGVVYMSFVPFDVTLSPPDRGWRAGREFLGLGISPFNLPDILSNIAFYMPVSTLGYFVLRRRMGVIAATLAILAFGSALSFGVEFTQQWTVTRVPAWADFAANVIGLVLGLTLAVIIHPLVRLFARSARESMRNDLAGTAAKALVCLLLLVHVRPFDLATDIPRTVLNAARHGNFRFTARWNDLATTNSQAVSPNIQRPLVRSDRSRSEYVMEQLAACAGYAALACLLMTSYRSPNQRDIKNTFIDFACIAWCGFVTISLAAMVTALRILMISHGIDTAHLLCGVVGWPLGVMAAAYIGNRNSTEPDAAIRPLFISVVALLVTAWVVLYELIPFDFAVSALTHARTDGRINLLPLKAHLVGSVPNLVADVSGKFIRYGALSACLAIPLAGIASRNWRRSCAWGTVATSAIVAALQVIHLFQPSRSCDATNVLIAGAAAFVTAVMVRGVRDVTHTSPRMVDDMLTRQLIDGESYDKNALNALRKSRSNASPTEAASTARRD